MLLRMPDGGAGPCQGYPHLQLPQVAVNCEGGPVVQPEMAALSPVPGAPGKKKNHIVTVISKRG